MILFLYPPVVVEIVVEVRFYCKVINNRSTYLIKIYSLFLKLYFETRCTKPCFLVLILLFRAHLHL